MTKTPTPALHRWVLLDNSGKHRGTCTARSKTEATVEFSLKRRKTRSIPHGWRVVDRGPVSPAPAPKPQVEVKLKVADMPEVQKVLAEAKAERDEAIRILGLDGKLTEVARHRMDDFMILRTQREQAHMALKVERDRADKAEAKVKELEGQTVELLGTLTILRGNGMLKLEKHLTPAGQKMTRSEMAAVIALLSQELALVSSEVAQGTVQRENLK